MRTIYKIILPILLVAIVLTGCANKEPITLDDQFYNSSEFIKISAEELENLKDSDSSYVIYTHNDNCTKVISFRDNLEKYMDKYQISFYTIPFNELKDTFIHDTVKYAPSLIIVSEGKVVAYLDADSDDDYDKYKKYDALRDWINTYIDTKQE